MSDNVNNQEEFGFAPDFDGSDINVGRAGSIDQAAMSQSQQGTAAPQDKGQQNAPQPDDVFNLIRSIANATAMSSQGVKFLEELKDNLAIKASILREELEVVSLPYPAESQLIRCGNLGIVLIFPEALTKEPDIPFAAFSREAIKSVQLVKPGVRVISNFIVGPANYKNAAVYAAQIINIFNVASNPAVARMTMNMFANCQITVDPSPASYEAFCKKYDPEGIKARADLTAVFTVSRAKFNRNSPVLFDAINTDRLEIGAVGGYVSWVCQDPNNPQFTPIFNFTNIITGLPILGLSAVLITLGLLVFVDGKGWINQFNKFGPDYPNIGNLVTVIETGAPYKASNYAERDYVLSQPSVGKTPCPVIHVAEGRFRIPGLEHFALNTPKSNAAIINSINNFLGYKQFPETASAATLIARNYIGTFTGKGGMTVDSRNCDYLSEMKDWGASDKVKCNKLLGWYDNPQQQLMIDRDFHPDLELIYDNYIAALNPDVFCPLKAILAPGLHVINTTNPSGFMDMSIINNIAHGYSQQAGFGGNTGFNFGRVNDFNQIWGATGIQKNLFS